MEPLDVPPGAVAARVVGVVVVASDVLRGVAPSRRDRSANTLRAFVGVVAKTRSVHAVGDRVVGLCFCALNAPVVVAEARRVAPAPVAAAENPARFAAAFAANLSATLATSAAFAFARMSKPDEDSDSPPRDSDSFVGTYVVRTPTCLATNALTRALRRAGWTSASDDSDAPRPRLAICAGRPDAVRSCDARARGKTRGRRRVRSRAGKKQNRRVVQIGRRRRSRALRRGPSPRRTRARGSRRRARRRNLRGRFGKSRNNRRFSRVGRASRPSRDARVPRVRANARVRSRVARRRVVVVRSIRAGGGARRRRRRRARREDGGMVRARAARRARDPHRSNRSRVRSRNSPFARRRLRGGRRDAIGRVHRRGCRGGDSRRRRDVRHPGVRRGARSGGTLAGARLAAQTAAGVRGVFAPR